MHAALSHHVPPHGQATPAPEERAAVSFLWDRSSDGAGAALDAVSAARRAQRATISGSKAARPTWDKAPAGAKKDAAEKHYAAAGKALGDKNEAECVKELDAAVAALN